ncbi:hypothetical protein KC361_g18 [Hortaea werneckii]|nr:hypothetical protein KC361_g18 [Hortaea werneckii]
MSVMVKKGSAPRAADGMLFTASTGIKHKLTQVACKKNATPNLAGLPRMLSKRLSLPPSEVTREKRNEPSRAAHIETAALNTTCLQFHRPGPPLLVRLASKLGHAAVCPDAVPGARRARRVGRMEGMATAACNPYARPMEGIRVRRKGVRKLVALSRAETRPDISPPVSACPIPAGPERIAKPDRPDLAGSSTPVIAISSHQCALSNLTS